jgi:anti-sigma regulatory factor (Ser/Thr protein kinase)
MPPTITAMDAIRDSGLEGLGLLIAERGFDQVAWYERRAVSSAGEHCAYKRNPHKLVTRAV